MPIRHQVKQLCFVGIISFLVSAFMIFILHTTTTKGRLPMIHDAQFNTTILVSQTKKRQTSSAVNDATKPLVITHLNSDTLPSMPTTSSSFIPQLPRYLVEEADFCSRYSKEPSVLIYVHTDPSHFMYRTVIRNTWGNFKLFDQLGILTLFFVGVSSNADTRAAVRWESGIFHDIIQSDFEDTYRNLTYKAVTALHWISFHCAQAKFVVKVDDDVFINIFSLNRLIRKNVLQHGAEKKCIFCWVKFNSLVERGKNSRWYVSPEDYAATNYPTYCLGHAFFMPRSVLLELYHTSLTTNFFWIDDVYVTGFLANSSSLSHCDISGYSVFNPLQFENKLVYGDAVFGHMNGMKQIPNREEFWKKVENIELKGNDSHREGKAKT